MGARVYTPSLPPPHMWGVTPAISAVRAALKSTWMAMKTYETPAQKARRKKDA